MQSRTLDILRNFASINQGIVFKPGKRLRTIAALKNVFAVSDIPDEIPREFAIYDLNEFLSTLSLFDKPEISYKEDHLLIQSGKSRIKYFYSSPAVVVSPPENDINLTGALLSFQLTEANLNQILKASAALKLKELAFDAGKITAYNSSSVGNQIVIDVDTQGEGTATTVIKIELLKLIPDTYDVQVFGRAVRFQSTTNPDLVYFITVEADK